MSVVKECIACGQGFDVNNNPVDNAIAPTNCEGDHKGPFLPIAIVVQQPGLDVIRSILSPSNPSRINETLG